MHVLVTGASGFIGRRLVNQLVDRDYRVTILAREAYAEGKRLPHSLARNRERFDIVYGDLRNYSLTARAVRSVSADRVFHLAAAGATDPFLSIRNALRNNLDGTINLIRACFENQVSESRPQKLVVGRTPGELSAMNVYAASKASAWSFCRMFAQTEGWPIYGAMIFQVYGPEQPEHTLVNSAMTAALEGRSFPMTSGSQERDWIFLDDVVDGLIAVLESDIEPGTTIDLGTGHRLSVARMVQQIYSIVGGEGRPLIGTLSERPGEQALQVADSERTYSLLGWRATTSPEQGLRQLLRYRTG